MSDTLETRLRTQLHALETMDSSGIGSHGLLTYAEELTLLREAATAVARQTWQPMATAPKDGTQIDVWLGEADEPERAFYCPPGSRRSTDWHWKQNKWRPVMGMVVPIHTQPTHWQPLPAPPAGGAAEAPPVKIDPAWRDDHVEAVHDKIAASKVRRGPAER